MTELWRIADHTPAAPAHLVVWQQAGVTVMACKWVPTIDGLYVGRHEMFSHRFACRKCMTVAKSRSLA